MLIERLLSAPRGQIFACNLIDGLNLKLIDQALLRQVFDFERSTYLSTPPADAESAIGRFVKIADHLGLYCRCATRPASLCNRTNRGFSNIMLRCHFVSLFDERIISGHLIYKYRGTGYRDSDFGPLEALNGNFGAFKDDAQIGFANGPAWLADSTDVDSCFAEPNAADAFRDRLGLVHRRAHEPLVSVSLDVDPNLRDFLSMNRPTAFDAGSHSRYRCAGDDAAKAGMAPSSGSSVPDEGLTVDLAKFSRGEPLLDGGREYVSLSVGDLRNRRPVWKGLGWTSRDGEADAPVVMDKRFAEVLLRGRVPADLQKELGAI